MLLLLLPLLVPLRTSAASIYDAHVVNATYPIQFGVAGCTNSYVDDNDVWQNLIKPEIIAAYGQPVADNMQAVIDTQVGALFAQQLSTNHIRITYSATSMATLLWQPPPDSNTILPNSFSYRIFYQTGCFNVPNTPTLTNNLVAASNRDQLFSAGDYLPAYPVDYEGEFFLYYSGPPAPDTTTFNYMMFETAQIVKDNLPMTVMAALYLGATNFVIGWFFSVVYKNYWRKPKDA